MHDSAGAQPSVQVLSMQPVDLCSPDRPLVSEASAVAEASNSLAEPSSGLLCKQTLLQLCQNRLMLLMQLQLL